MSEYDEVFGSAERDRLSKALPKGLRLAISSNDSELTKWIRLELLGYTSNNPAMTKDVVVPEYRTVGGQWFDEYGRVFLVTDPKLSFVNETRLRPGVGELEGFVGKVGVPSIRLDTAEIIRERLGVDVSVFRFSTHAIEQVLANIRAQFLDRLVTHRPQLLRPEATTPSTGRQDEEVIILRPSFYGIGVNLRALWRRWRSRSRS